MEYLTLVPIYGRDYKTAKEVKAAWEENKDFRICAMFSANDGKAINKQDATAGTVLNIRYKGLTQICQIKIK